MEAPQHVVVVARRAETLDGLHAYLDRLGVPSHCARTLDDLEHAAPEGMTALVVFPDDLAPGDVLASLATLRRDRPRVRTIVITRSPERFRVDSVDVVLPRPAFGWDILDAILGRNPGTS
jgi:DNA-binding NtrC family response regulator